MFFPSSFLLTWFLSLLSHPAFMGCKYVVVMQGWEHMRAYKLHQFSANLVQARASLPVWTTAGRSGCGRGPGRQVGWMTLILMLQS